MDIDNILPGIKINSFAEDFFISFLKTSNIFILVVRKNFPDNNRNIGVFITREFTKLPFAFLIYSYIIRARFINRHLKILRLIITALAPHTGILKIIFYHAHLKLLEVILKLLEGHIKNSIIFDLYI